MGIGNPSRSDDRGRDRLCVPVSLTCRLGRLRLCRPGSIRPLSPSASARTHRAARRLGPAGDDPSREHVENRAYRIVLECTYVIADVVTKIPDVVRAVGPPAIRNHLRRRVYHQTRRGWNAFVRIRLALTQKPFLQQKALENMRAGGKIKGWANLPDPQRIDVRQGIAIAAGVCPRNVSKVEKILEVAHPRLIEALRDGRLKIDRWTHFCNFPKAEQLEQFIRWSEECATRKVIRQCIAHPKETTVAPDAATVLDVLQQREVLEPGWLVVRSSKLPRTVVLIGRDFRTAAVSQKDFKLL